MKNLGRFLALATVAACSKQAPDKQEKPIEFVPEDAEVCMLRGTAEKQALQLLGVFVQGEQEDRGLSVDVRCNSGYISDLPPELKQSYEEGKFPLKLAMLNCERAVEDISIHTRANFSALSLPPEMDIKVALPFNEGGIDTQEGDEHVSPSVFATDHSLPMTFTVACEASAVTYCSSMDVSEPDSIMGCVYMSSSDANIIPREESFL